LIGAVSHVRVEVGPSHAWMMSIVTDSGLCITQGFPEFFKT